MDTADFEKAPAETGRLPPVKLADRYCPGAIDTGEQRIVGVCIDSGYRGAALRTSDPQGPRIRHKAYLGVSMQAHETGWLTVPGLPGIENRPGRTAKECHQAEKLRAGSETFLFPDPTADDQTQLVEQVQQSVIIVRNPPGIIGVKIE
jgi:hypothetical protein